MDPKVWAEHFPENYRERISPEFLAEVYSAGVTGEQYARNFLRDRELLECQQAREIIAVMSALDTMLLVDKEEGFLNRVSTEKLSRKALGLIRAYEKVSKLEDWQRPKGKDGDKWRSKVDWDAAKRIDPFAKLTENTIRIPAMDEEIRKGMDQEALYIRTAMRLEEAATGRGPT